MVISAIADWESWIWHSWLCLLIVMTCLLIAGIAYQFYRYSHYPTLTKVDTKRLKSLAFPAVTICSLNQYKNIPYGKEVNDVVKELSEVKDIMPQIFSVQGGGVVAGIAGDDLMAIINSSYHRIAVKLCKWGKRACEEPREKITEFGLCKTYNADRSKRWISAEPGNRDGLRIITDIQQDDYYFSSTIQMGIKVILHEPDEEPFPEKYGFDIGPGKSAVATIRQNEEISLEYPYRALSGDYCLDTTSSSFDNPLKRYGSYSQESCLKECLLDKMESVVGCRRFFDPGNTTLCSSTAMLAHAYKTENLITTDCICDAPCKQTWYDYSVSYTDMSSKFMSKYIVEEGLAENKEYISDNIIDLRIYYDRLVVQKVEQVPELTLEGILGTLGGMMGLFVGASLLSLIQLLEFLVLGVCRCVCSRNKIRRDGLA